MKQRTQKYLHAILALVLSLCLITGCSLFPNSAPKADKNTSQETIAEEATENSSDDSASQPDEAALAAERCISYMEDDLLQGQLVKRSTSPMSNIAHSLEMECKQKLLKDFQNLNKILQSETVGERIRPQESTKREITPAKEKKKTGPRLR